jgi:tRNA pseudouridine55 synthase
LKFVDGVIVLDKPLGWTSHDAVAKVRKLAGTRRVGHLGTLDPIATGVLPLVVGRATRLAQFYLRSDKVYDAIIRFGYATDTYDSEGQPTTPITEPEIDRERLEQELARLRGTIRQMPPPISAKKVGGVPAYRLARKNIPVELKPVEVSIYSIELLDLNGPEARILVHCSAGTYLRTVAHDLGIAMGCGAHLKTLRRTATGEFTIERAHTIEELEELARQGRLKEAVIPMARLLPEFPSEIVDSVTASHIRHGRDFRVSPFHVRPGSRYVKAITQDGDLIAIGEARLPNLYHPIMVL